MYKRQDSTRVSAEAQDAALAHIRQAYGDEFAPAKPNVYKGRKNAQDAHEAIRPTYIAVSYTHLAVYKRQGVYCSLSSFRL